MKYLSVCSGIEAASVAFEPLGWRPLAFSEIEAFPRAVLVHHYPDVPCHGDFTRLKEARWIVDADMLCGGTPCQAFSVAGNRQSLADDRGNLTLQFVLLADAIDHLRSTAGREPAWILWENVPGVLSTNDNAFGAFLGGLVGRTAPIPEPAGGWTRAGVVDGPSRCAAWRTLDAQHFGLAQRRQRVFVLARGGAGRWAVADALLPIIESSRWHPAPSRGKGQGVAPCLASGDENSNGAGIGRDGDPMFTLDTTGAHAIAHTLRGEGFDASENGTGRGVPLLPSVVGPLSANGGTDKKHGYGMGQQDWENGCAIPVVMATGQAGAEVVSDGSPSLTCNHDAPILMRMREGKEGGGKGPLVSEDQSLTLATGNDQVLCASLSLRTREGVVSAELGEQGIANALRVSEGGRAGEGAGAGAILNGMQVRRLTPVECERLQGFPDGYTAIPWRGKPADKCPDGPRYKALGNSWAVNCARYIGERIKTCMTT